MTRIDLSLTIATESGQHRYDLNTLDQTMHISGSKQKMIDALYVAIAKLQIAGEARQQ